MAEHQIYVRRNGKMFVMTVNGNPRLAQAMNGLTNPDAQVKGAMGWAIDKIQSVNRHLSNAYTSVNPDFVVSNFLRDAVYTNLMTWVKESPEYAIKFHANYGKSCRRIYGLLKRFNAGELDMSNELDKMYYEFMMNGGETGYTNIKDIEKQKKKIKKMLERGDWIVSHHADKVF